MTADLAPAEEAAIAAAVADAATAQEPLLIMGNGTKSGMLRPVQAARSLSTRNHIGITLYSPNELVIAARAGTPMADIEATLAEHGQHIIGEPPDLAAVFGARERQTLGGVIATNLSGPRRVAWGAMRDHVLGMRAVTGWGEVIRSGGRVLKNVTGLDLCKLLTGSHGTLGVITEVTLKVLPAPEAVGTVILPGLNAVAGVAALSAALGSPYSVSAAAWLPAEAAARVPVLAGFGGSVAMARIEDFAASVIYRTARLRDDLNHAGAELLDDGASRDVWRSVRDLMPLQASVADAVWRVSVRPSAGPVVLRAVSDAIDARGFLDWGGGLVWLAGPATAAAHAAVQTAAKAAGGSWMLMRAAEPLRASVEVIPPEPEPLSRITRRVKAALDPGGILNPGRMYAGL
jgi:glycolate oxidase FAD binding subunit